jgi:hypothetical protein
MLHLLTISVFQYMDSAAAWLEMHMGVYGQETAHAPAHVKRILQ